MLQFFLTLSLLVGSWGSGYFKGNEDGFFWFPTARWWGRWDPSEKFLPIPIPVWTRALQAVNLHMADSMPAAGLQGILVQGTEKGTGKQKGIGSNRQAFRTGDQSIREGWDEWQWKGSSWEKCGVGKSWGLRTRTSAWSVCCTEGED